MNSKFKFILTIFILFTAMVGLGYKKLLALDTNSYVKNITEEIQNEFGAKISFEKAVVSLSPYPQIKISKITIDDGLFINQATIKINLLSVLTSKKSSSKIQIAELFINPKNINLSELSYHNLILKLKNSNIESLDLCATKIWDTALTNKLLSENTCVTKNGSKMQISSFISNKLHFQDTVNQNKNNGFISSNLKLYTENASLNVNTEFSEKGLESGEFDSKIKNLNAFANEISSIIDLILNNNIKSKEEILISGKIIKDKDSVIIDNIEIKGENLDANGIYWFASNKQEQGTLNLKINKINPAALFASSSPSSNNQTPLLNLNEARIRIVAQSDKIILSEDIINNFQLDASGDGDTFKIDLCSGKIESGGDFKISGKIESNKYRPKFIGDIIVNHNNINNLIAKTPFAELTGEVRSQFYLKSDIIATPIDFKMLNFKMIVGSENISGNLNIKLAGNEKQLIGDIDIDDLNISTTTSPLIHKIYEYIVSLGMNMHEQSYTSKLLTLRTFPIKTILDLNFDGITFSDKLSFDRMSFFISYDSGQLKIDDFLINQKDKLYIQGNGRIFSNSLEPQIKFNISKGNIKFGDMDQNDIDKFIEYTKNNIDLAKIDFSSEGTLDNLEYQKFKINNLSWQGKNDGKIFTLSNLKCTGMDGDLVSSGSLSFNPLKLSFTFGIDGVDINQVISSTIKNKLPYKSGHASINGQLSSTANNFDDLLYNLYLRGDFLSKNLKVNNIDIDGLIVKLSTLQLEPSIVDRILIDSATSGATNFDEISGSYELNNGLFSLKNMSILADTFAGSAGLALNIYDQSLDLNSIFSFYPSNSYVTSTKNTLPVKVNFAAKGNLFSPDKQLTFQSKEDIQRLMRLVGTQNNANSQ